MCLRKLNGVLILAIIYLAACSPKILDHTKYENKIECYLKLENDSIRTNQPVLMQYVLVNQMEQDIYIQNTLSYGYYIDGLKEGGFDINIQNSKGEQLKKYDVLIKPQKSTDMIRIQAGESYAVDVDLSMYKDFEPGETYRVKISKELEVYLEKKRNSFKQFIQLNKQLSVSFYMLD